jgi:hypothetical protein
MSDTEYNGWTNRATWLVNIWFNPESKSDVEYARETLDDAIAAAPDFLRDFIDTDINWDELLHQFKEEEEEEEEEEESAE